jgi:hypothetical protein
VRGREGARQSCPQRTTTVSRRLAARELHTYDWPIVLDMSGLNCSVGISMITIVRLDKLTCCSLQDHRVSRSLCEHRYQTLHVEHLIWILDSQLTHYDYTQPWILFSVMPTCMNVKLLRSINLTQGRVLSATKMTIHGHKNASLESNVLWKLILLSTLPGQLQIRNHLGHDIHPSYTDILNLGGSWSLSRNRLSIVAINS